MSASPQARPEQVVRPLERVINDLDALAACFAPDDGSNLQAHPELPLRKYGQMRLKHLSAAFSAPYFESRHLIADGEGVTMTSVLTSRPHLPLLLR